MMQMVLLKFSLKVIPKQDLLHLNWVVFKLNLTFGKTRVAVVISKCYHPLSVLSAVISVLSSELSVKKNWGQKLTIFF